MHKLALALLLGLVLFVQPAEAPAARAQTCDPFSEGCFGPAFAELRNDINTYVASQYRAALLERTSQAERLFPSDPIRTCGLLTSVNAQVVALDRAGHVSSGGLAAIQSDISAIINLYPTDPLRPCLPPNPV